MCRSEPSNGTGTIVCKTQDDTPHPLGPMSTLVFSTTGGGDAIILKYYMYKRRAMRVRTEVLPEPAKPTIVFVAYARLFGGKSARKSILGGRGGLCLSCVFYGSTSAFKLRGARLVSADAFTSLCASILRLFRLALLRSYSLFRQQI